MLQSIANDFESFYCVDDVMHCKTSFTLHKPHIGEGVALIWHVPWQTDAQTYTYDDTYKVNTSNMMQ